jgi:DNA transformation protein
MAISSTFREFLAEQFAPLGGVEIRRMFGGAGAFWAGQIFALIDDDVLYFKVDGLTLARYEAEGMTPFTYPSKNGLMVMEGYRRCPDWLFDEPDDFLDWAKAAIDAAGRTRKGKARTPAKVAAGQAKSRRKPA